MRIAFMGASGTGKTTLARWVSETYGLPMIQVGSRYVAKEMGFDNPYDVDAAGKRAEFQHRLQSEKIAAELPLERFVTDRTPLDELAYSYMHDLCDERRESPRTVTELYRAKALVHMKFYDCVFWCPISAYHNLADDPCRKSDRQYHVIHEALMVGLIAIAFLEQVRPFRLFELRDASLDSRMSVIAASLAKPLAASKGVSWGVKV